MKALYALYSDPDAAQRAVDTLKLNAGSLGIGDRQIVVVTAEPFDGYDFSDDHADSPMFMIASFAGIFGGLMGYLLTRFTQVSYPLPTGGMPIVPPWTNAIIVYEMTMLGAIVGTVISLLVMAGLPHFGESLSDPDVWHGKILVGVTEPPEKSRPEIDKQLRQAGASEIKTTA